MEPPKRMRAKKSDESKKNRKMEGVVLKEQRPLIAYLQVHTSDIDFNLIGTNETTVTDGLLDYTEILSLIDKESSNYHIQEKIKMASSFPIVGIIGTISIPASVIHFSVSV